MALSGKVSTTFGPSGHYTLEIDWSATQNTSNNTSTVTAQMWMYSDPQWSMYTSSTKYGNIKLNGTNYAISQAGINTGGGSWLKIGAAQSWTINHNSDGTGSFTLGGDLNFSGVNVDGTIINDVVISAYTQYLDTIPRETKLSSPNPPNWTAGNSVTFSLTRYSSAFSETVTLEVYNNSTHAWVTVSAAGGLTTSATFGTNSAQNTIIFQALAQQATCQSRLTITTYSGAGSTGSVIGSSQVYTGTVTAPAATKPTMSSFNIGAPVNIILNPTNSEFTHTLSWSWNSYNPTITTGVGSGTYTWDTSSQDSANGDTYANLMYKQIPNSKSLGGTLHCDTYYNSVKVRSTVNVTPITGSVVNSNPTFTGTGITYTDNASAISAITGDPSYIVQNASDLLVSLPTTANAIPTNFATISYYVAQCGGSTKQVNYSSSSSVTFDLGKINLSANDNIYVTAYDSRGFSAQTKLPVNIVAWKTPTFNSTSKRDDGFDDPSTITLTGGTYSTVAVGVNNTNDIVSVKYQYTVKGTAWPTGSATGALADFPGMTHSGGSFSAPGLGLTLASGSAWSTEVQVLDKIMQALGQSPVLIDNTVNVGTPILFVDTVHNSIGVGKFPSGTGTLETGGDIVGGGKITSIHNTLDDGSGNLTTTGSITSGGTLTAQNTMKIKGSGTGSTNTSFLSFYQSDGTTRTGFVGDGYSTDSNIQVGADSGGVLLVATGTNVLMANADGTVTVYNPINMLVSWTNFYSSMLLSWVVYGSTPTYQYPSYGKDSNGYIHLRGSMKSGSNGVFYTLPAGCRPANKLAFPIVCGTGSNNTGYLTVDNTGALYINVPSGANNWVPLDGITFFAEQ